MDYINIFDIDCYRSMNNYYFFLFRFMVQATDLILSSFIMIYDFHKMFALYLQHIWVMVTKPHLVTSLAWMIETLKIL